MSGFFIAPLRYLRLRNESGSLLWLHDMGAMIILIVIITLPFALIEAANYVHKDGFIDKVGSFSSVLTGFYVAGLVAVTTLPRQKTGLDAKIQFGKIKVSVDNEWDYLTRREYVCSLFGYLSTLSLIVTVFSIISVIIAQAIPPFKCIYIYLYKKEIVLQRSVIRLMIMIMFNVPIAHLAVSTFRGLYYLIDRLYAQAPVILPKQEPEDK